MNPLRRMSTPRLAAYVAGVAVIGAGAAGLAAAMGGGGPTPPRVPLATAVHRALAAPAVPGITARIAFTNHLIDSSSIEGGDPLLTGASGRLWLTGDGRLRLELQSSRGDAQILVDHRHLTVYDPSQSTAYTTDLPGPSGPAHPEGAHAAPGIAQIQQALTRLARVADISGPVPGSRGGQPAYTVTVSPKHDGGLLGRAELAWDAATGVPLRVAVFATNAATPTLELSLSNVSYGPVAASDVTVAPPPGTRIVTLSTPRLPAGATLSARRGATAATAGFPVAAPASLDGLPRRAVRLISGGGRRAVLVTYGRGLGGIAVFERPAGAGAGAAAPDTHSGLRLPTVSINGATARELDTALGTVVQFTRKGVSYTVIGSVPPIAAEAAARALS